MITSLLEWRKIMTNELETKLQEVVEEMENASDEELAAEVKQYIEELKDSENLENSNSNFGIAIRTKWESDLIVAYKHEDEKIVFNPENVSYINFHDEMLQVCIYFKHGGLEQFYSSSLEEYKIFSHRLIQALQNEVTND